MNSGENIIPLNPGVSLTTTKSHPALHSTENRNMVTKISAGFEAGSLIPDLNQLSWSYFMAAL